MAFFSLFPSEISSNSFLFDWGLNKSKGVFKYTPRDFRLGLVSSLAYWPLFLIPQRAIKWLKLPQSLRPLKKKLKLAFC